MTNNCFDIGTIQAFLDGELDSLKAEAVARHVAACDDCAILLATAEEETAFAFSALEQEFNTLVPTRRLWTKINDSIERERKSFWKPIFAFLLKPSTAAFASILFVAVVSVTLLSLKPDAPIDYVAQTPVRNPIQTQPVLSEKPQPIVETPQILPEEKNVAVTNNPVKMETRAVKTVYVKAEENRTASNPTVKNVDVVVPELPRESVLGEESYLKTIATLTQTVNSRKNEVLNSSARFDFERDMAVTNDAISRMKSEVRKNPNNEAAKQILRSSYQNKIDLLNSVAEKTELMASLK